MTGTRLGIAQLAVSIAGFEFNGMVFRALIALVCFLTPIALGELGLASPRAWSALRGWLGAPMALQVAVVLAFFLRPADRGTAALRRRFRSSASSTSAKCGATEVFA